VPLPPRPLRLWFPAALVKISSDELSRIALTPVNISVPIFAPVGVPEPSALNTRVIPLNSSPALSMVAPFPLMVWFPAPPLICTDIFVFTWPTPDASKPLKPEPFQLSVMVKTSSFALPIIRSALIIKSVLPSPSVAKRLDMFEDSPTTMPTVALL
jgi:hypothetical protein